MYHVKTWRDEAFWEKGNIYLHLYWYILNMKRRKWLKTFRTDYHADSKVWQKHQ